ncbi:VTT domain-containing protein [Candidatus Uhrbacteria bacterium]|nr:VTT domain-containing protein [Candidatus Uhrbacteria bacterium]
MESLLDIDLVTVVQTIGIAGIAGVIFAETGLLVGFFLPGDSLLFTAGFLASQGLLNIVVLTLVCFVSAVLGDSVGYAIGRRLGPRIFTRENSRFFQREYIERTKIFYEKYGGKTIILARFIPIIRTFAPVLAGVGKMHYPKFLSYNLIGGFAWGACVPLAGYFLGSMIPSVDRYLFPIIGGIIVVSIVPPLYDYWRHRKIKKA